VNGVIVGEKMAGEKVAGDALAGTVPVDAVVPRVSHRLDWILLAVAVAATLVLYAPTVASMASEWSEFPSLSHGFAVPVISGYLLWRRRHLLALAPIKGSMVGLPVIGLALAMLVIGSLSGEPFVARISLPLVLLGAVLFLMGGQVTRKAWVAIGYLVFMIPLPYLTLKALTYESRLFDAGITARALGWLGVPVLRDGVMLHLPNMTLEVADDCSSVPAIAALLALGAAYSQIQARPTWVRGLLTLAAAPLGLLSNIIRLIVTAVSAYYFGPIALNNVIHKFNGTSVFLATVLLLVLLDALLGRAWKKASP
jgi:exosortase